MIDEANYNRHEIEWEGRMEAYYAVEYEGYNIWAATAGMCAISAGGCRHDARDFVEPVFVSPALRADRVVGNMGAPHQPAQAVCGAGRKPPLSVRFW